MILKREKNVFLILFFVSQDCGLNVHEKYLDQVPKTCTKYKSVTRDPTSDHLTSEAGAGGRDSLGYSFDHRPQSGEEQDNISYQVRHRKVLTSLKFTLFNFNAVDLHLSLIVMHSIILVSQFKI